MKTKVFSIYFCLVVLMSLLPNTAFAAIYGDLAYEVHNGYIEITDCKENVTSVDILSEINGLPVTIIGDSAFATCGRNLINVNIPDSITYIGRKAFYWCSSLTEITIPNSVTYIGDSAFYECSSLTSLILPDSVTEIGNNAFYYCSSLKNITMSNSMRRIGDNAFIFCNNIERVNITNLANWCEIEFGNQCSNPICSQYSFSMSTSDYKSRYFI